MPKIKKKGKEGKGKGKCKASPKEKEEVLVLSPDDPLSICLNSIPQDWFCALNQSEFQQDYFKELFSSIRREIDRKKIIYPAIENIFNFTNCPLENIKVVILGQDPYHGPSQAHGLCFSVQEGIKIPPSLRNIYKELKSDIGLEKITINLDSGDLTDWLLQGVLLLNSTLTVEKAQPNSHSKFGWERFTDAVIDLVDRRCEKVVFLLWGENAKLKAKKIDTSRGKHLVLECAHPSPLSASRGFLGCKHFSKTNQYLKDNGIKEIKW